MNIPSDQRHTREYRVHLPGQLPEHRFGISRVGRLAYGAPVKENQCVSRDYYIIAAA
jgi:hypothetical protein